jgi:hypothetical protein
MTELVNQFLEIRFKPNPQILDFRGTWAKAISEHLKLMNWRIIENRIDMTDDEKIERAFVSFRNLGYSAIDCPSKDFFADRAIKFIRYLFDLKAFEKENIIERIGVRAKFCQEFDGEYESLLGKYLSGYLNITQQVLKEFNAKIVDIGGSVNYEDAIGHFNTMSGPMPEKQMHDFIETKKEFPQLGLFLDIDYWNTPQKEMAHDEIIKNIKLLSNGCWEKFGNLYSIILASQDGKK